MRTNKASRSISELCEIIELFWLEEVQPKEDFCSHAFHQLSYCPSYAVTVLVVVVLYAFLFLFVFKRPYSFFFVFFST